MTSDDDPTGVDADADAVPERESARSWPGPDLYTLRGWVEVELALAGGAPVDAAHALLSDAAQHAFGPRVFEWVGEALADEGREPDDLAAMLADDLLTDRVLGRLRARMAEDDEAPDPPSVEFGWSAYSPDDPRGARESYRRAVHRRAVNVRWALLRPPRRRVAGRRR